MLTYSLLPISTFNLFKIMILEFKLATFKFITKNDLKKGGYLIFLSNNSLILSLSSEFLAFNDS
jgi:hypothetical protein